MPGQLTQIGEQFLANKFSGQAVPFIGGSAPGTWIPGQEWINGAAINVYDQHTSAWVTGPYDYYMALLTSDPSVAGAGGTVANLISDVAPIEDTTAGYLRQPVTLGLGTAATPSVITNTNLMTFGAYTANQSLPIGWTALMAIPASDTGGYVPLASTVLNGLLLYLWTVPVQAQVLSTQTIQIAPGTFQVGLT